MRGSHFRAGDRFEKEPTSYRRSLWGVADPNQESDHHGWRNQIWSAPENCVLFEFAAPRRRCCLGREPRPGPDIFGHVTPSGRCDRSLRQVDRPASQRAKQARGASGGRRPWAWWYDPPVMFS